MDWSRNQPVTDRGGGCRYRSRRHRRWLYRFKLVGLGLIKAVVDMVVFLLHLLTSGSGVG